MHLAKSAWHVWRCFRCLKDTTQEDLLLHCMAFLKRPPARRLLKPVVPIGPPRHYLELCNFAKPAAKAELSLVQVGPWRSWAPDLLRSARCSQATCSTRYCFQSARCLKNNFYSSTVSLLPSFRGLGSRLCVFGTCLCEPGTGCHEGGCRMPDNCTASHSK